MFGTPQTPPAVTPQAGGTETLFEQMTAATRHTALDRLLGQGRPAPAHQVQQFLDAAADLDLPLDWMWARPAGDGTFASVMLIAPQAGGTGMVFISRPRGLREVAEHAELADFACRQVPPERVAMAQALLSPEQELERAALERGGFHRLATLIYMQRGLTPDVLRRDRLDGVVDWPEDVRLVSYSEERRPQFLSALAATYEQTLDCPALYGRRDINDVLRGHMATGRFEPELWTLLLVNGEPAGVMLLNPVPTVDCVELVYLGLALPARGRGLADRLLRHGIRLCAEGGHPLLTLAVDEGNAPARRLYERFGFRRTARKIALIRHLRENGSA